MKFILEGLENLMKVCSWRSVKFLIGISITNYSHRIFNKILNFFFQFKLAYNIDFAFRHVDLANKLPNKYRRFPFPT